jgi:glycine/serine hydroxymethyltransferase
MKEREMKKIARLIDRVLSDPGSEKNAREVRKEVDSLAKAFPLYKDLIKRLEK